jgi:LysR family transcriptional regulator for metE and metH
MTPHLDISHLQAVAAMFDHGTMRPAAEGLGLTQPALGYRLKEAERRLGVELFVISGRRFVPTPAAERLLISAREILRELNLAEAALRDSAAGITRTIWLSVRAQTAFHWLPPFLELLRRNAPDLRLSVRPDANTVPLASLREGRVDLALVAGSVPWPEAMRIKLFTDSLVAVVSPDHPASTKPYLDVDDLASETFVTYGIESEPDFEDTAIFRPGGRYPARTMQLGYAPAAIECAAFGGSITVVPRWVVARHVQRGQVVAIPLGERGVELDWWISWNGTSPDHASAARCARLLADWCQSGEGVEAFLSKADA